MDDPTSPPRDPVPLVERTRRDVRRHDLPDPVESSHRGHVVVVDPTGEVVVAVGDPERLTFVRSAAKPFQATACLEVLDEHALETPPPDEVAVAWASHRAEPRHLAAVARLVARAGIGTDQLTCPAAVGEDRPSGVASRLQHNCSGKHAAFAVAGTLLGCPRERWLDPDGALQRRVLQVSADALGEPGALGIDGCGAPAVAVPLHQLARAYGRLVSEDRWQRVRTAGASRPGMVGGRGRFETALLAQGLTAKPGAEGVFACGWRARAGGAWGVAIKVEDGAGEAAAATLREVLVRFGVVGATVWQPPPVLGGGRPVGEVRPAPSLRSALDRARSGLGDPRR